MEWIISGGMMTYGELPLQMLIMNKTTHKRGETSDWDSKNAKFTLHKNTSMWESEIMDSSGLGITELKQYAENKYREYLNK